MDPHVFIYIFKYCKTGKSQLSLFYSEQLLYMKKHYFVICKNCVILITWSDVESLVSGQGGCNRTPKTEVTRAEDDDVAKADEAAELRGINASCAWDWGPGSQRTWEERVGHGIMATTARLIGSICGVKFGTFKCRRHYTIVYYTLRLYHRLYSYENVIK